MDTQTHNAEFLTLTEICRVIYGRVARRDRARLAYVIECIPLAPARTIGTVRVWHRDSVPVIRSAAGKIGARSKVVGRA